MAAALLVACNGEPQTVPVTDVPTPAATNTPFPTPTPTSPLAIEPAIQPSLEAATPTPAPAAKPTATPTATPTLTPVSTPTPAPTTDLVLDARAQVIGYWSDGSANVELTATVHNQGDLQLDVPAQVAVTCTQQGTALEGCADVLSLLLPGGYGPVSETLTLRVPAGETRIRFAYGSDQTETLDVSVSERILGVDRDVWECFSDTSNVDTIREADEGTGCGAWPEQTVLKWNQHSPIRISATGPESFVAGFKDVISELSPVLNLRFEWVDAGVDADAAAYVGLTIPEAESQGIFCRRLEVLGCANTSEILVLNRWRSQGYELSDFGEPHRTSFRGAMIHEAVHAFSLMQHRTELLSVMNAAVHHRAELSPMDEALLRLHGHELIEPGMSWTDIERLIVFNDELLDPQQSDTPLAVWTLVSDAYRQLREATSASFRVRSSSPDCSEEFGWADYAVGNLTAAHPYFGWVRIDDGSSAVYALQPGYSAPEYWRQSQSGWSRVNLGEHASGIAGWRGDLSDPHHLLESILYYADWADAKVSTDADGQAVLRFTLDMTDTVNDASARSVDVVLLIDQESGNLSDYRLNWNLSDAVCRTYQVEAVEGRYGIDFTFPDAVRRGSDLVQDCTVESLGLVTGYTRRSGEWLRECGLDPAAEGYTRSYRFSLEGWSFVRLELASFDDIALNLLRNDGAGSSVVAMDATGYLEGGYGVPDGEGRLSWAQVALPPGKYVIQALTRERALPDDFTLTLTAQQTPPPPYRFKSISAAGNRTCGLLTDGTPLCWGRRNVEGAGSETPDGKFASISASVEHVCTLQEDGAPVCWDFKDEGEHTCAVKAISDSYCTLNDLEDTSSLPPDRDLDTFVTRSVGVVAGYYDITPPAGERLVSISNGWVHTCGLRANGTAVCWGSNQGGKSSPPPGERFKAISGGVTHTCALRQDGAPVCWGGENTYGEAAAPQDERFVAISAGERHSCGLREDGTVVCWGSGGFRVCTTLPGGDRHCSEIGSDDQVPLSPPSTEQFASLSSGSPVCV